MKRFVRLNSRSTPVLNAYVVVADVSLSLLMIIITYFVVSSHLTDAVNARKARPILALSENLLSASGLQNMDWRNGNEVLYKFSNAALFKGTDLTYRGSLGMGALARTMRDPSCSQFVQDVRVTVSEPASYSPVSILKQVEVLTRALYANRIDCPVISAARLNDQDGTSATKLAETDIVIELK